MKRLVVRTLTHPLISGSAIVFLGTNIGNVFHFLFNLYMSRNLSVTDYGILASLISLIGLATLGAGAVVPVIVSFAGEHFAKNDLAMAKGIYTKISTFFIPFACLILLIFLLGNSFIGGFFHVADSHLIIFSGFIVFFSLMTIVNQAFLQAKLAFNFISFTSFLAALLKFSVGVLLVVLGWHVFGAVTGLFLACLIPYLVSFIPLRFLFHSTLERPKIESKKILLYAVPATLISLGVTNLISTDVLLVKHFFDPHQAGLYAGLSLIGRVIFFFSSPISTVMFPLLVQKYNKNENHQGTFFLSLLLVLIPSLLLLGFYVLFPVFTIKFFLKKDEYLAIIPYLIPYASFIILYSLLTVFINFFLAIKKTRVYLVVILGAILQGIMIWYYHGSFMQVILISFIITALLLAALLLYYLKLHGKKN